MTQPEETTAALIARLHEQNRIANMELARLTHIGTQEAAERERLKCERDEQLARAEKLAQHQSNYGQAWRQSAALATKLEAAERALFERTRERDEAMEQIARALVREEGLIRTEAAVIKERDEAREQLAKLEWAQKSEFERLPQCAICGGIKPSDYATRYFMTCAIGHRPTCWFAKKEAGKVEIIRNHRQDCPARTVEDVAWVDSRWQVNGCRTAPIEGPRPKPIGCEVCMCARPSCPEPRFKVGEKVWAHGETYTIASSLWHALFGFWSHKMESGDTVSDHDLKPAPKFAVGEWVVYQGQPAEVLDRKPSTALNSVWDYVLEQGGKNNLLRPESSLTAQTPQHKQCGAGYVFLGRMTNAIDTDWDLWFVKEGSPFVPGPALASDAGDEFHMASAADKQQRPELIEARRRAVARGLVKP